MEDIPHTAKGHSRRKYGGMRGHKYHEPLGGAKTIVPSSDFEKMIIKRHHQFKDAMKDNMFMENNEDTNTPKGKQGRRMGNIAARNKLTKSRALVKKTIDTTLLTEEQELFCQYVVEGYSFTKAYHMSFKCAYSTANTHGSQLARREVIIERIKELKLERAQLASQVTPQESLARWNELYKTCLALGDVKMAMEAQKNIDKINGAGEYYSQSKSQGKNTLFSGETMDEWAMMLPTILGAIEAKNKEKASLNMSTPIDVQPVVEEGYETSEDEMEEDFDEDTSEIGANISVTDYDEE